MHVDRKNKDLRSKFEYLEPKLRELLVKLLNHRQFVVNSVVVMDYDLLCKLIDTVEETVDILEFAQKVL